MVKNVATSELIDEEAEVAPDSGSIPVWLWELDISAYARIVFCYLKVYHGRGARSKIFPGQALIAERNGISIRTVKRSIKELETSGAIGVQRRGKNKTNVYTLYWFGPRKENS